MTGPALTPFWWDAAPRDLVSDTLPEAVDVAVVGRGYTGLSVALHQAEGEASVTAIDAGPHGPCGGPFDHLTDRGRRGAMHDAKGSNLGADMPLGACPGDSLGRRKPGETGDLLLDAFAMQTRPRGRGRHGFLPACTAGVKPRDRRDGGRITA